MATVCDKNVKKRVKVPQVQTVPSDDMLPIPDMSIQKKMVNSLPNEMLRYIFDKLEMNKLIGIRGVCTRWQGLAEDICRQKRSILIESKAKNIPDPDLSVTFNGLVDFSKGWTVLKVKPIKNRQNVIALSTDLCILLGKLFPHVENLVFNVTLQRNTDTADSLLTLLNKWSSTLVALCLKVSDAPSLNYFIVKSHYDQLFDHINNLTNLKRFAFYEPLKSTYKLDFLTRLEHCTIFTYYSDLLDTIPLLGKECTSLSLLQFTTLKEITQFLKLNAPLVKGLTHLRLIAFQPEVLSFVCGNFSALQMLDIDIWGRDFNADIISDLARLSKLSQLSIRSFEFDLSTLARSNLSTLSSVQILAITHFEIDDQQFDGDKFCRVLSFVFPNLHQLTIKHRVQLVRNEILVLIGKNESGTRFWNQSVEANNFDVREWHRVSDGHWLNRLTHLALFINSSLAEVIDYLTVQASSLRVLHLKHTVTNHNIFTLDSTTIRNLSRLVHLTELELDWVTVDVSNMERAAQDRQLASLKHIRIFRLTIYRIDGNNPQANCSDRLMRTLSMIVPNVEQLTIAYYCADQLANIELYLMDRFDNLREHEFVHRMIS